MKTLGQLNYEALWPWGKENSWDELSKNMKDRYERGAIAVAEAIVAAGNSANEDTIVPNKFIPEDIPRSIFGFWLSLLKSPK